METVAHGNLSTCRASARLRMGVVFVAVALGLTAAATQPGVPQGYRLALIVPFFIAAVGVLQGVSGTCVRRAARGEREEATGAEPILNPTVKARLRTEMHRILARATAVAVACTALVFLLP
jgi:hypothetical protein